MVEDVFRELFVNVIDSSKKTLNASNEGLWRDVNKSSALETPKLKNERCDVVIDNHAKPRLIRTFLQK